MAWTVTARGQQFGYGSNPTAVSDTFTPSEGEIIIALGRAGGSGNITGANGWGATWVIIDTEWSGHSTLGQMFLLGAIIGASPGSDSLDLTTDGSKKWMFNTIQIAGADVSGTVQSIFSNQAFISNFTYNPSDPMAIGGTGFASAFGSATNGTLCYLTTSETSGGEDITPQSGFTEYGQQSNSSHSYIETHFNPVEEQDPTLDRSGGFFRVYGAAWELKESAVANAPTGGIYGPLAGPLGGPV